MKRITLILSDEIIARALDIAQKTNRELEDVVAEWIDEYDVPVEKLSDEEILLLCDYEMNPYHAYELRNLLYHHREGDLDRTDSERLDELLQIYRKGIVRKSRALQVAAARGLSVNHH